jgi:hypothetical protein
MFAALIKAEYQGILINGYYGGTQLYDPFNTPHAQGNLDLGLQTGANALAGAAVINGHLAYFASGQLRGAAIINLTRRNYTTVSLQMHHLSSTTQRQTLRAYWRRCRNRDGVTA